MAADSAEAPVRLFSDKDEDSEPAAVIRKIKAEIALGDQGKGRLLVVTAVTTDEWGCECPTLVYAPFATAAEDESTAFFYPLVKSGPAPDSFVVGNGAGSYELTGRFTREKMNFDAWLTRRKVKHRATRDAGGSLKAKQPVFAVERWCFRKADEVSEAYAGVVAKMKKAGVAFCK